MSEPNAFHSFAADTLRVRHAQRGLKLIIPAELLAILTNALLIGAILMRMDVGTADPELADSLRRYGTLLMTVRFVLGLVGCILAGRDDERFSKARTAMILAVVFDVYNILFSSLALEIAKILANVWATLYVIEAVRFLAIRQGEVPFSEEGRRLRLPVCVACGSQIAAAVLDAAYLLFSIQNLNVILSSAVVFLVLEIAVSVLFLRYLFRAKSKLCEVIVQAKAQTA